MIFKIEKGGSETLHVGMSKSSLMLTQNTKCKSFKRNSFSEGLTYILSNDDMYAEIEYKNNKKILSLSVSPPSIVSFNEFNDLFKTSTLDIYRFLKNSDNNICVEGSGITSNKYQFGLYMPFLSNFGDDDDEGENILKIESIIMFEVGYYDELLKSYPSALHDERLAKLLDQAAGL